jgi:tetratricopeptide (TPR) repeat protein
MKKQYKHLKKSREKHRPAPPTGKTSPYWLPLPVLLTFLLYTPSLLNDFVPNWDDGGYVLEYEPIQRINTENIKEIFTSFYKGNYHPLTTTFYALIYAIDGDNAFYFHLLNLLLHCANVWLVFLLIRGIFKKQALAFWVALIFGIHPMHVESVAWISELKDVLYTFFYLLSLLAYLRFQSSRHSPDFLLSLFFFALSLLSKSAAVTLPLVILLIDYFRNARLHLRSLLEKLPFFLLSVLFGVLALLSQGKQGAIQDLTPLYGIIDRVFIVSYAFMTYVVKFFAPLNLMAMYPYPGKTDGFFPWEVYAALAGLLAVLGFILFAAKRKSIPEWGMLFFIATSILTLQIIPVGGAVVAERYTYVPYIGLSLIPLWFLGIREGSVFKTQQWQSWLLLAFSMFLAVHTHQRISVWENGLKLFSDVIEKNPNLPFAYNNRGYAYQKYYNDMDKALADYSTAIRIDSTYYRSLSNRGVVYFNLGDPENAIRDFTRSLDYHPQNEDALLGRANSLSSLGRYANALPDYDRYLELQPGNAQAWLWRGVAHYNTGAHQEALKNILQSRKIDPQSDEAAYWEALSHKELQQKDAALQAIETALRINPQRYDAALLAGLVHYESGAYDAAIEAFELSTRIEPQYAPAYVNKAAVYAAKGDFQRALGNLRKAVELGYPVDKNYLRELETKAQVAP